MSLEEKRIVAYVSGAINQGKADVVAMYLSRGGNPNAQIFEYPNWCLLHQAVDCNEIQIALMLLEAGADRYCKKCNTVWCSVESPLSEAVTKNRVEMTSSLLQAGTDPNHCASMSTTPLHFAAIMGKARLVEVLLKAGASPNVSVINFTSPLHFAAEYNFPKCIDLLLRFGACIEQPDVSGRTALYMAAENGNREALELLLRAGADPHIVNRYKFTPVKDNVDVTEVLARLSQQPSVVPLQVLCLRAIHYASKKPDVPEWFPTLLLEWPDSREYLLSLASPTRSEENDHPQYASDDNINVDSEEDIPAWLLDE